MNAPALKARFCRKAGQPIGMVLSHSRSSRFLAVTRVEERGAVNKCNDSLGPGEMIAPGDLICVVNGVRGTDGMMAVLRNADVLEFEIEFMKSTGTYACDFPELREDLKQALPEYEVSWSKVTTAVLKSKQAGGFLTKGPQYSFEVNLLRTGMLELTNLAPKTKSAKHQKEFVRVSALVADVGSREVRRRQGEEDDESEQDDEFEQDDAFVVDGEEVVGTPAAGVGTPATTPQHRKAEAAVASPAGPLAPPPPPAGIFGWSPQRAAPASGGQFSFVGAVGSKPGSRPNGKFTSSMKALSESYKKGDLSEEEFQQKAAAVVGWELLAA